MFVDGRTVPDGSRIDADLCIVGAGPAGIALALEFVHRTDLRVALLETGGLDFDPADQDLADAEAVGHKYFPVRETRIRMFGGSTISWGGILSPLDPIDFEHRPWVPNSGWPIERTDLDPYYAARYPLCEVDPPDASSRPAPAVRGQDRPPKWSGHPSPSARRPDSGESTPADSSHQEHHDLSPHDGHEDSPQSGGQARRLALNAATRGGNRFIINARHYVFTGGGIENARILLSSRDVQPKGIGNSHDLVGRFFQEHPRAINRYRLPDDLGELGDRVIGAAGTLRFSRLGLTEDVQRREQLLNFIVNLSFGHAGQETPQFEAARRIVNASRAPWSDSPYYQDTGGGPNRVRWQDVKTCIKRPDRTAAEPRWCRDPPSADAAMAPDQLQRRAGAASGEPHCLDPQPETGLGFRSRSWSGR